MTFIQSIELPGKLPFIANLILALLLVWVISGWFGTTEQKLPQVQQTERVSISPPELSEIQGDLFGKIPVKAAVSQPVRRAIVKSPLNVRLLGTVVAGDNSAAVIATSGRGEQKVLFIGGEIQSGVTLHEVLADAIVLDRNGSLEKVMMDKSGGLKSSPMRQSLQSKPASRPVAQAVARSPTIPEPASAELLKLVSQARVMPHFVNGKAEGFLVSNIVPGSIYDLAGVENGDVVGKVNGQEISNAQQAMTMYQSLQKGGRVKLERVRAGKTQQLDYDCSR